MMSEPKRQAYLKVSLLMFFNKKLSSDFYDRLINLLDKVCPIEFVNSVIYTKALAFYLMPSKYNGSKIQLARRKSRDFKVINLLITMHRLPKKMAH